MGVIVAFLLGSSFAYGDVTIKYDTIASTLTVKDDLRSNKETIIKNYADEFIWTVSDGVDINKTVKIDNTVNKNKVKDE